MDWTHASNYLRGRVDNFSLFKKGESAIRKTVINQYAEALHYILWVRSFDKQHLGGKTLKPSWGKKSNING